MYTFEDGSFSIKYFHIYAGNIDIWDSLSTAAKTVHAMAAICDALEYQNTTSTKLGTGDESSITTKNNINF